MGRDAVVQSMDSDWSIRTDDGREIKRKITFFYQPGTNKEIFLRSHDLCKRTELGSCEELG